MALPVFLGDDACLNARCMLAGSPGLMRALLEGFRLAPGTLAERSADVLAIFMDKVCTIPTESLLTAQRFSTFNIRCSIIIIRPADL